MKLQVLLIAFLSLCLHSCISIPKNTHTQFERIATGMGPEDVLLDSISTSTPRLLISCNDHRLQEEAPNGAIYAIDLDKDSLTSYKLIREGEPDGHDFHPHGFDLIRQNGKVFLYIVSHDNKRSKHFVYKYEVSKKKIKYIQAFENPLMNSPNTVVALSQGGFYVSIDQGRRGNQLDLLLKAKTGSVVYCDEKGAWARAATKLAYPNGLFLGSKERYLYVSTTRQNQVFKYQIKNDGNLVQQEKVTKIVGGDNIRPGKKHELIVPAHLKALKFVGHFKDSTKLSPSVVYSLNTEDGSKKVLYSNNGKQISAASTAVVFNGYIYVSQVFQPFVLRIKRKEF